MNKLPELSYLSSSQKDDLIHLLWKQNQLLQAQNAELQKRISELESKVKKLEDKLNKNSGNSNKPPSSDGFTKPQPKSLRGKSHKKRGGQPGHRGSTLKRTNTPDKTIILSVTKCQHCASEDLTAGKIKTKRQVFDIPPLTLDVTEYQIEVRSCRQCGKKSQSEFPDYVTHPVQYGPEIKSLMVYLHQYQLLPYERLAECFHDLFEQPLSMGTLYNTSKAAFNKLESTEALIKEKIIANPLVHSDETALAYDKKVLWLHVASNSHYTYYCVHKKRGREAMEAINILPQFQGTLVHDHFKTYFKYGGQHALCNAHILRELIFLHEQHQCQWAKKMERLLINIKKRVEACYLNNQSALKPSIQKRYRNRFMNIIDKGRKECPKKHPPPGTKRKVEQSKAWCLLERLRQHNLDVLRFMADPTVPFDNNLAERDIRMVKVKQKISGCYRSQIGAQIFCRIRSYISTLRKHNLPIMNGIKDIFYAQPSSLRLVHG